MVIQSSSAIFSPTAARLAATTAKDWNTVDSWLHRLFQGRAVPNFERNADTLKALLALAAFNQAADDERDLLFAAESEALDAIKTHKAERLRQQQIPKNAGPDCRHDDEDCGQQSHPDCEEKPSLSGQAPMCLDLDTVTSSILELLESTLPKDGQEALHALAELSVILSDTGPADPALIADPVTSIATKLLHLQSDIHILEQQARRLDVLSSYINIETERTRAMLGELTGNKPFGVEAQSNDPTPSRDQARAGGQECPGSGVDEGGVGHGQDASDEHTNPYFPPPHLARQNLSTQRLIKQLTDDLAAISFQDSVDSSKLSHPTVITIIELEKKFKALVARKRLLEEQVNQFDGLPPEPVQAKRQLDIRKRQLAELLVQRDVVFEGLVERESPVKRR